MLPCFFNSYVLVIVDSERKPTDISGGCPQNDAWIFFRCPENNACSLLISVSSPFNIP